MRDLDAARDLPRRPPGRPEAFAVLVGLFFCAALVVGGSSVSALSVGLTQLCAIPVLAWAVWRWVWRAPGADTIWPLLILAAVVALVILQLMPLPPEVWRALPGRRTVADVYDAMGVAPPPMPLSLAPDRTLDSALGLVPPTAMFLAMLSLESGARRWLAGLAVAIAVVAVALGLIQMAQGPSSVLRFYAFTNPDSPVGFFANRNHQAAFLASTLPLAAALLGARASGPAPRVAFWTIAAAGFAVTIALGAAATGSRAGALLVVLGLLGAVAVAGRAARGDGAGRRPRARGAIAALVIGAVIAGGLIAAGADSALARRFQTTWAGDLRFELNPLVARAGLDFAPLGSGVGSFAEVYPMVQPRLAVSPIFVNHAHDDFLEIWLECGWPGVALMAAFVIWWWRRAAWPPPPGVDAALARAGSIIIFMLLLHSAVDYPLRIPALATLFAFACGLTVSTARLPED